MLFKILSVWLTMTKSLMLLFFAILIIGSWFNAVIFMKGFLKMTSAIYFVFINNSESFLFSTSVIFISIMVFSWSRFYMSSSSSILLFYILLFMFVMSMAILVMSESFMSVFLGWEGLGITSFLLIIFYQNWHSMKGGVLTLMTNRIGDAILMISFSYWILLPSFFGLLKYSSILLAFILVVLSLTKSAQVPFTSWLPAAMAAPTPVSALVHSSTLVTAGIWLMIRFGQFNFMNNIIWFFLGVLTLSVASTSALVEKDAKKVVALSTLSQLGLMYLSLSLGGKFICLFHLLMHAFAKANLFLMVGNFIHFRFSQQDVRFMSIGNESFSMLIMVLTSILSLSGAVFLSGFFSKEVILLSHYSVFVNPLSFVLIFLIVTLTISYCLKIFNFFSLKLSHKNTSLASTSNVLAIFPSIFLSGLSMFLGLFYFYNVNVFFLWKLSLSGVYWSMLFLLFIVVPFSFSFFEWNIFFQIQVVLLNYFSRFLFPVLKNSSLSLSSTLLEAVYLSIAVSPHKIMNILAKSYFIMFSLILLAILIYKMFY